jgi:hypothetical protein
VKRNTEPSCDEADAGSGRHAYIANPLEQSEKTDEGQPRRAGAVPRIDGSYIDAGPVPRPRDNLPRGPTLSARTRTSEHVTFRQSSEVESIMIKGKIVRIIVLVAGATGLLALFETTAHAGTNLNHCEPLQRV